MDYVIMRKDDLQPLANAIKEAKGIPASTKLTLEEMEERVLEKNTNIETCEVVIKSKTGAHPDYILYEYLNENGEIQSEYINNSTNKQLDFTLTGVIINSWVTIGWSNATYGGSINCERVGSSVYAKRCYNGLIISNTSSQHVGGSN